MKKRIVLAVSIISLVYAASALAAIAGTAPQSSQAPVMDMLAGAGTGNVPSAAEEKPKTYTIAELYKEGTKLHGKRVTVHGRVVKVLAGGIMKKIYSHLQDGTGDKESGNNDVVILSQLRSAAAGDEVIVTGTIGVHSGKGAKVMIYDAVLTKVEGGKADTPKVDAPKSDAPEAGTSKADAPKVDAPKIDAPAAEKGIQ